MFFKTTKEKKMITITITRWTEGFYANHFELVRVVGPFSDQQAAEKYLCHEGFMHHGLDWGSNDTWERDIDWRTKEYSFFCPLQPSI
jgi:hypothetical protein